MNPFLILDCAWRVPDWALMKEALTHVETSCPNEMLWKVRKIFKLLTKYEEVIMGGNYCNFFLILNKIELYIGYFLYFHCDR